MLVVVFVVVFTVVLATDVVDAAAAEALVTGVLATPVVTSASRATLP